MVVVQLTGGLGNQMFQYAAGRSLALHHQTTLKLDLSWYQQSFERATKRTYQLGSYRIQASAASPAEILRAKGQYSRYSARGMILRIFRKLKLSRSGHFRELSTGNYQSEIFKTPRMVYLSGYWQSERYFSNIASIIRTDFTVANPPNETNCDFIKQIQATESVSLHIRRGDYVSNPRHTKYHGVLPLEYYENAAQYIASQVAAPLHFFVFSDDLEWVSQNLKLPHPMTLINHNNPDHPEEDLRLMNHCKHHIIANSSFSWWGAWLANNPVKVVCAPARWFNGRDSRPRDLIPESWVKF